MSKDKIEINTEDKSMSFGGFVYKNWSHLAWLKAQLLLMEHNAQVLWGPRPIQTDKPKGEVVHLKLVKTTEE